jgi:hypothetical protein
LPDDPTEISRPGDESENDTLSGQDRDPNVEKADSPCNTGLDSIQLRHLAEYFRELSRIECDRGCACWDYDTRMKEDDRVTIVFRCECGETAEQITMGRAQFIAAARGFLDDEC